jgi:hypothetical protein
LTPWTTAGGFVRKTRKEFNKELFQFSFLFRWFYSWSSRLISLGQQFSRKFAACLELKQRHPTQLRLAGIILAARPQQ